jgi:uncharacterized membrane protein
MFEYTKTSPVNYHFFNNGYETRNLIQNLNTYSSVTFTYVVLATILMPVAACIFISFKKFFSEHRLMLSMWIRFALLSSLTLFACVLVSFMKPSLEFEKAPAIREMQEAKFSDSVANIVAMVVGGILVLMVVGLMVTCFESRKYAKAMMEERNAAFASEILFAFTSSRFEIVQKYAKPRDKHGNFIGEFTSLRQ